MAEPAPTERPVPGLVAEACQRSPVVWVTGPVRRARPVWSAWHDDALVIVVDGEEQPDPVPSGADRVEVSVRSKSAQWRLVTFEARVEQLDVDDPRWRPAAEVLRAARLNLRDHATALERWARDSRVVRLVPDGEVTESPGEYESGSGGLPPAPTTAVTVRRRPFHLGGRSGRRR